jgi:hypothetical protein
MTTESTQPQSELGPAPANGQGSRRGIGAAGAAARTRAANRARPRLSSNRRSRNRRNPQLQAPAAPPAPQHKAGAPAPGASGQGQGNQGRKKKKFFQKGSAPPRSPATASRPIASGQAQGQAEGAAGVCGSDGPQLPHRQRQRSRRPALDHSDDGQRPRRLLSRGLRAAAGPVREDAPTRIFCFIEDLFFLAKIQETARKLGVKVEFVKGDKESVAG